MTPKERLLAAIVGKEVDRMPWSPFLAYYWESLPIHEQEKGQIAFLQEIGADPLLRGFHQLFEIKRKKCIVSEKNKGNERVVKYETPVGTISEKYVYSKAGFTWFITEHPVKSEDDFKVLTYINEDMKLERNVSKFIEDYNTLGDNGLYLPIIGTEMKSSFQSLVEHWVGTEELVYALADYPEVVEECLQVMKKNSIQSVSISVKSPAEGFIFWEDSSTTNISPTYFKDYIAPEINEWGKIIHNNDKYLVHHACGHINALIDYMSKTEIDMIESISPPPTGNIELWDARARLPDNIGLIGGIEPGVFLNSTMDELEEYVITLLEKMNNKHYILANSDSCPPGVDIDKFRKITKLAKQYRY